jgi:hypothetical protein
MIRKTLLSAVLLGMAVSCLGLEKERSLVTGKNIGDLAVAGRLLVEIHAEFMMSRTFENETVLNWYNLGKSGGACPTPSAMQNTHTP